MFASSISWLKMCKKRAIKTGKMKDVTGTDKNVILCNKMFWKLHEMIMTAS